MPYFLNLEIPGLPSTANTHRRRHWSQLYRESKEWHQVIWAMTRGRLPKGGPLKKAQLILTRVSAVSPDSDGLVSSFKWVIDGLVRAGVLVNDGYGNIGMPEYRWEKGSRGQGKIRVVVISDES